MTECNAALCYQSIENIFTGEIQDKVCVLDANLQIYAVVAVVEQDAQEALLTST